MNKFIRVLVIFTSAIFYISCHKENIPESGFEMVPYLTFQNWDKRQGGAIFGDILVCMNAADKGVVPNGFMYDIKTGAQICEMTFQTKLHGKEYFTPHANQISFGNEFYDEFSDFPLLYVSQVNGGSGYNDLRGERGVLVYNLKKLDDKHYNPELVQVIVPDTTNSNLMSKLGNYTPNYIVDNVSRQIIIIGYPNKSWYDLSGVQPIAIIDLPLLSDGPEILFTDNDIVDYFSVTDPVVIQQSFCHNKKVFISCGFREQASIRIIDLNAKSLMCSISMTGHTDGEPQFIGLWKDKILYYEYDSSGVLYELTIPGYQFNNYE